MRSVATFLFGAMWLVAAVAKLARPAAAHEFAARAVPDGLPPGALLPAAVGLEAALGAAMCLGVVRSLLPSLAGIAAVSATLLAVRAAVGASAPCGCFGELFGATVDEALARNAFLLAVHGALAVATRPRPGRAATTT